MSLIDFGPEPSWLTCACGVLTTRTPCWTCSRRNDAANAARREKASAEASIPSRFRWAQLGAPELQARVKTPHDVRVLASRLLGADRALLVGGSGAGKTSLACACLRERLDGGRFVSALRLGVARAQAGLGGGEAATVEQAIAAPLLVIDDVGQEAKIATNAVRDVVFARHDEERPTWATTGLTVRMLAELYGDGFARRLSDGAVVLRLGEQ